MWWQIVLIAGVSFFVLWALVRFLIIWSRSNNCEFIFFIDIGAEEHIFTYNGYMDIKIGDTKDISEINVKITDIYAKRNEMSKLIFHIKGKAIPKEQIDKIIEEQEEGEEENGNK